MNIRNEKDRVSGEFSPEDFIELLRHLPETCTLVGGQAVAWWARKYGLRIQHGGESVAVTSEDIDFWGSRADVVAVSNGMGCPAVFPHKYEMTVWAGGIPFKLNGCDTIADFLHSIPGLDTSYPQKASTLVTIERGKEKRLIQVLTPISLLEVKVHALRHFNQEGRQDLDHLRICIQASKCFLAETLEFHSIRHFFWNAERVLMLNKLKAVQKLEQAHGFSLLDAIPVEKLEGYIQNKTAPLEDREKLANFLTKRWLRSKAESEEPI